MSEKESEQKPKRAKPDDLSKASKQANVELDEDELKRVTGGKLIGVVKYPN